MKKRVVLLVVVGWLVGVAVNRFGPARPVSTRTPSVAAETAVKQANVPANAAPGTNLTSVRAGGTASKFGLINPYAAALKVPGKSKRAWDLDFMKTHQHAAAGDAIEFELTGGRLATGVVRITQC